MPFVKMDMEAARGFEGFEAEGLEKHSDNEVWPLIVAILDKEMERNGRTTAVLVSSFVYIDPKTEKQVLVPAGYVTDFASIPAPIRAFIAPFGRHAKAAVLHDWLYAVGQPKKRGYADGLFSRAMRELGVGIFKRWMMFLAVRLFAGGPFKKADTEWATAWADWETGKYTDPQGERSAWYSKD